MKKTLFFTAALLSGIFSTGMAQEALDSAGRGLEIMTRSMNRNKGETLFRRLTATTLDKRGKKRVKVMSGYKKYYADHSKSVVTFDYPKNIKETTLLTYDYNIVNKVDDQWIYLPAVRKTKRIPASRSAEYFMGTDFTFEDMKEDVQLEKFTYRLMREDEYKGRHVYIVESIPKNREIVKEMGYSKILEWIDKDSFMTVRAVFFDKKGRQLKELDADIVNIDGIYTYSKLVMSNKKRRHKTIFEFDSIEFNKELDDSLFNKQG